MSNYNEQMRIAKLESARNEANSTLIDQAIKNGGSLEELIDSVIKDRDAILSKAAPNMTKSIEVYNHQNQFTEPSNSYSTQAMSTSESNRVAQLESIRNGENTELIDQAIHNGQTAGQVAHSMLKDKAVAMGGTVDSEIVNAIANGINDGRQPLDRDQKVVHSSPSAGNPSIEDTLVASLNKNRQASGRE